MDTNFFGQRRLRPGICSLLLILSSALNAQDLTYTVQKGDTLYSIARKYGIKPDELILFNGIDDVRKLYVGKDIRIPVQIENETRLTHKTSKGETLTGIARKYGISLDTLFSANNLNGNYVLKIGDTLTIPVPGQQTVRETFPPPIPATIPAAAPPQRPAERARSPAKPASIDTRLRWPLTPKESAYMSGVLSPGMLLTGERGEAVRSISAGTVVSAGPYRGFGRVVIVKSDSGYDYFYGGCEKISVKKGDRVLPGTEVGRLGVSAMTAKPQLTFMVYHNHKSIDPAKAPRA